MWLGLGTPCTHDGGRTPPPPPPPPRGGGVKLNLGDPPIPPAGNLGSLPPPLVISPWAFAFNHEP